MNVANNAPSDRQERPSLSRKWNPKRGAMSKGSMKPFFVILTLALGILASSPSIAACVVPNVFVAGTTADPAPVNGNFSYLESSCFPSYTTGTWTPRIFDDTTLGISYSTQVGFYSKLCLAGQKCTVTARFRIGVSALTHPSTSGQGFFIQGIPFDISSSADGAYQHLSLERVKGVTGITDGETGQIYGQAFPANRTLFYMFSDQTYLVANSTTSSTILEGELIYNSDS